MARVPFNQSQRSYQWDRGYEDGLARRPKAATLKDYVDYGRGYGTGLCAARERDEQVQAERELEKKADDLRPVLEYLGFVFDSEGKVTNAVP